MTRSLRAAALALALVLAPALVLAVAPPALAQVPGAANVNPPVAATSSDAATLAAMGGVEGLRRIVDDGVNRLVANPLIGQRFRQADLPGLKRKLTDQFCALLGGPCRYEGQDMAAAHRGMNIRQAEFNALVEEFERAMDAQGVPYFYQTRLLAKLAPMQREMVGR